MKLKIKRDFELDPSGVTPVWAWECPHCDPKSSAHKGVALFWENAIRGAGHHLSFHRQRGDFHD